MQSSFKVFSAIQFCEFILHKWGKYIWYIEIEYFHLTGIYCYCFKQITFIIDKSFKRDYGNIVLVKIKNSPTTL